MHFFWPEALLIGFVWGTNCRQLEVLCSLAQLLGRILAKANNTLLLDRVEEVEAASWPVKLLVTHALKGDVTRWIIADADVGQVFELHGVLELDLEAPDLGNFDEGPRHHVKCRMVGLNIHIHRVLLVVFKMLKMVEILQEVEAVPLLDNLLVPLHLANGLAVLKDLADMSVMILGSHLVQAVDLKMDLEEEELLLRELLVVRLLLIFEVDLAGYQFDQLVLHKTCKFF